MEVELEERELNHPAINHMRWVGPITTQTLTNLATQEHSTQGWRPLLIISYKEGLWPFWYF